MSRMKMCYAACYQSFFLSVCSNQPTAATLPPASLSVSDVCLKEEVNYRSGLIEWVPSGRGRGMRSSNEAYISGPQPAGIDGIDFSLCVVSVCPCEYERLTCMGCSQLINKTLPFVYTFTGEVFNRDVSRTPNIKAVFAGNIARFAAVHQVFKYLPSIQTL